MREVAMPDQVLPCGRVIRADLLLSAGSSQPCRGHKRYVGGPQDGSVSHMIHNTPSDFPMYVGSVLVNGTRSWYEIDYEASEGSEVVYQFIGMGREMPQRTVGDG
jgi:hypothetical protein